MEYILHRFLFHMEDQVYFPRHPKFYAFHFLVHGIHHAFPQDPNRIVMPPALGHIIFYSIVYPFFKAIFPKDAIPAIIIGFFIAYLYYDLFHHFCHNSNPKEGTLLKKMQLYHMRHHYRNGAVAFGVSSKFWDVVFQTKPSQVPRPKNKSQ